MDHIFALIIVCVLAIVILVLCNNSTDTYDNEIKPNEHYTGRYIKMKSFPLHSDRIILDN